MDYVLNEHLDFKPTWSICNTINDNIVIQLIWKFQESNWNPDWFIALMDSFDTNYIFTNNNKANLRDLIAATCLVILLKLDLNRRFFSPCDLDIWWMTQKNNKAPLLCNFKLFASFHSHCWIQTGVTVQKRLIWVKIDAFFLAVWPWNLTDDLQKQ